ncbi:MAG TPA: FtsX-like permease family protein [Rhodanobacteraceae bacterium]|nr:FtsX-like permease family protein [Rhodanobacteraceae bacterium]
MPPIIAALKHHKTTVILVALEIALTCAIVTNALFLIGDRLGAMAVTTGVATNELVWARSSGLRDDATPASRASLTAADLAALRAMPGVTAAVMVNSLPLSRNYWSTCLNTRPGGDKDSRVCNVVQYIGSDDYVRALGMQLSAGRDFLPQEYVDYTGFNDVPPKAMLVTKALAERLWPGQRAVGQAVFLGENGKYTARVVGVVSHLLNPSINKNQGAESGYLLPVKSVRGGMYVVRTEPEARDAVYRDLPKVLDRVDDQRIITDVHSYADTVRAYYRGDRAMVWLLLVVIGCLLALTALGVVGLSSFWVQQRTHQIGIRRAIGATRRDILRYFLTENFLIVSLGIALGLASAVGLNLFLMQHYELPRLPLVWLPAGALVLWLLGQLAVLGPALRASRVPPVVATRSV